MYFPARTTTTLMLAAMLTLVAAHIPSAQAAKPVGKTPNIVFILTDDLDAELFRQMPRLDAMLTRQGTTFENHFVSISLCCPSRAATLLGQFAHNSGMYGNTPPNGGFELMYQKGLESSTIATWLKDSGYRTALVGKYLNGYPNRASATYIPPGWSEWYTPAAGTPYQSFDYTMNENGKLVKYAEGPNDHITDVVTRLSVDFIKRSVAEFPEQPFFAYIAPYAPHAPATPPTRYASAFPELKAPRPPSFNEADVSDKPAWLRKLPLLGSNQITAMDELYRDRRRSMLGVEDLVQSVLDTLKATGQMNNTFIFFASDNGYHQGQHRMDSGKGTPYEEDLIVPLIARGPGIAAGKTVSLLTANVDYASTFAELAGVTTPSSVDGRSLVPFLKGKKPRTWRQALLLEYQRPADFVLLTGDNLEPPDPFDLQPADDNAKVSVYRGLRTASGQTYVEYKSGDFELYDHKTDPFQITNGYPQADAATKARLNTWTNALRLTAGQALRTTEEAPPARQAGH